jgi:hypothetical protein
MCRSTLDGGRRCPSHTDPVLISNRNARRRAKYAQQKPATTPITVEHAVLPSDFQHSLFRSYHAGNKATLYKAKDEEVSPLGVTVKHHTGLLAEEDYFSKQQNSGQINYTKLDENSYAEFGFQGPDDERVNSWTLDQLKELSEAELGDMTISEKKALQTFTGDAYKMINISLYGKKTSQLYADDPDYKPYYNDEVDENGSWYPVRGTDSPKFIQEFTELADSALTKTPKQQRILYRGMARYHSELAGDTMAETTEKIIKYVDDNYSLGQEVMFDGFQSASYSPTIASDYSGAGGIVFEIKTASGANVAGISEYGEEREVILPRHSRYMVVGVHKKVEYVADDIGKDQGYHRQGNTTVIQLIEITDDGYVRDETNFTSPPPLTEHQLRLAN